MRDEPGDLEVGRGDPDHRDQGRSDTAEASTLSRSLSHRLLLGRSAARSLGQRLLLLGGENTGPLDLLRFELEVQEAQAVGHPVDQLREEDRPRHALDERGGELGLVEHLLLLRLELVQILDLGAGLLVLSIDDRQLLLDGLRVPVREPERAEHAEHHHDEQRQADQVGPPL